MPDPMNDPLDDALTRRTWNRKVGADRALYEEQARDRAAQNKAQGIGSREDYLKRSLDAAQNVRTWRQTAMQGDDAKWRRYDARDARDLAKRMGMPPHTTEGSDDLLADVYPAILDAYGRFSKQTPQLPQESQESQTLVMPPMDLREKEGAIPNKRRKALR